jgi:hypothetical protein
LKLIGRLTEEREAERDPAETSPSLIERESSGPPPAAT